MAAGIKIADKWPQIERLWKHKDLPPFNVKPGGSEYLSYPP